ncbi:hypothetical protein LCGC14_1887080, partial [marine sediment metagenome]
KKALPKFEGMFAFAWLNHEEEVWVARDAFGRCPLHVASDGETWYFASEIKALAAIGMAGRTMAVPAGDAWRLHPSPAKRVTWTALPDPVLTADSAVVAAGKVKRLLDEGTKARMLADVPICTLLSGGLDSTLITAILAKYNPNITAFHAVFNEDSADLRAARVAAKHIGVRLVEVHIDPLQLDDISNTIWAVETGSKVQVEIALACIPLAKAIRAHGFKAVFSGDGSDELWGSYGFSQMKGRNLTDIGWARYRTALFLDQQRRNFIRANKAYMHHGIEVRIPFTHRPLVEYALSLPKAVIATHLDLRHNDGRERRSMKAVLEAAAEGLLPTELIYRPKLAFQVGTGLREEAARVCGAYGFKASAYYKDEYTRLFG